MSRPELMSGPGQLPCPCAACERKRDAQAKQPARPQQQHFDECECGKQHPEGWICAAAIGGKS